MSLEIAQLHKIYASSKYSPDVFFLNPFTEILFTPNWAWPEEYMAQKKHSVKKPYSNSDNLKEKIKEWQLTITRYLNCSQSDNRYLQLFMFQNLDFQSQRNCLAIKDKKFISTLCHFLPSHNSDHLYNMKNRKYLKSFEAQEKNSFTEKGLILILQSLEIAFLKQPVLHLCKNSEKFVCNELIKWMEIISYKKIFQFTNKIKQSELPEENILWFSQHSFHRLECFFVNQFEKSITTSYFNRDRIQSNYLMDIKDFCRSERDYFRNKNVEYDLICYPLYKTIELSEREIEAKFNEMKEIEEKYEMEKEQIIQKLLDDQLDPNKEQGKKKRRRIRKKTKNQNEKPAKNQSQNDIEKKTPNGGGKNINIPKFKKFQVEELLQTVQDEEGASLAFNDEISLISKCEDSEFHQTDVTFQKYFENEDKNIIPELQYQHHSKSCETSAQEKFKFKVEQSTPLRENPDKGELNELIISQVLQVATEFNEQNSGKLGQNKQKKKTKKEKMIESLNENLIKTIRNAAFTEFIDTISIESNNLYNYKLSAYQFVAFFISSLLPTTNITLFGSNAVGLSLASSDIDIMISHTRWSSISEVREVLYHIGNGISKMGWVVDFRLILNAKVPVLKLFIDPKIEYSGLSPLKYVSGANLMQSIVIKADIIVNIEGQQNIGCESTLLMKDWLGIHPQLQRIILFFKYVLWYYGLNENYRGGICSYCLFLMVVSCLFKKVEDIRSGEKNISQVLEDEDEGTYIIQILKYYSEVFDPKVDEISITRGLNSSTIENKDKNDEINFVRKNLTLKIVDPINGEFIESSFAKFQEVQQLFSMILVESMKLDNGLKNYLTSHEEINEQFSKHYQTMTQNSPGYNVITKNMEQVNEAKTKKIIKKISGKIRKNQDLKYTVKDIVSIGFKIGIQNWMGSSGSYQDRFNI